MNVQRSWVQKKIVRKLITVVKEKQETKLDQLLDNGYTKKLQMVEETVSHKNKETEKETGHPNH